ncbi:hypothetical protein RZS08_56720, partial [Arthrospira platensis SPKY1]|nr:hypothetical protein [Arthrospira platensis SPKY1]
LNFATTANNGRFPNHHQPTWCVAILGFLQGVGPDTLPKYDPSILRSPLDPIERENARSYAYSAALANSFGWDGRFPRYTGARITYVSDPANTIMYHVGAFHKD